MGTQALCLGKLSNREVLCLVCLWDCLQLALNRHGCSPWLHHLQQFGTTPGRRCSNRLQHDLQNSAAYGRLSAQSC